MPEQAVLTAAPQGTTELSPGERMRLLMDARTGPERMRRWAMEATEWGERVTPFACPVFKWLSSEGVPVYSVLRSSISVFGGQKQITSPEWVSNLILQVDAGVTGAVRQIDILQILTKVAE